jgi:hypothetical protein
VATVQSNTNTNTNEHTIRPRVVNRHLEWTNQQEELLMHWVTCADEKSSMHEWSHLRYRKYNTCISLPVIALATLTGGANLAVNQLPTAYQTMANGVIGGLSILGAIVGGAAVFLKFAELQEKHKYIAIEWRKIHADIQLLLTTPYELRADAQSAMDKISSSIRGLIEQAPVLPKAALKRQIERNGPLCSINFRLLDVVHHLRDRYEHLYPQFTQQF